LYEKFNGDIHFCHISIFDPFFWGFCVEIAVVLGFCVEIHVVLAYCDYLESGKEPWSIEITKTTIFLVMRPVLWVRLPILALEKVHFRKSYGRTQTAPKITLSPVLSPYKLPESWKKLIIFFTLLRYSPLCFEKNKRSQIFLKSLSDMLICMRNSMVTFIFAIFRYLTPFFGDFASK
jgi:hypothetical protein